jgi:hypothetical protein
MHKLLSGEALPLEGVAPQAVETLTAVATALGRARPTLVDYLWLMRDALNEGQMMNDWNWLNSIQQYGLVQRIGSNEWQFTDIGRAFMLRMRVEKGDETLEQLNYSDGG